MLKNESLLGIFLAASGLTCLAGALGLVLFLWAYPPRHQHRTLAYQGAASCAECHPAEAESWRATHMAASFELLRPGVRSGSKRRGGLDEHADYTRNEQCLRCHTTGHGRTGGFVSLQETPALAGVTCESCHGPGGRYLGTGLSPHRTLFGRMERLASLGLSVRDEPACRQCHDGTGPFGPSADLPHG